MALAPFHRRATLLARARRLDGLRSEDQAGYSPLALVDLLGPPEISFVENLDVAFRAAPRRKRPAVVRETPRGGIDPRAGQSSITRVRRSRPRVFRASA